MSKQGCKTTPPIISRRLRFVPDNYLNLFQIDSEYAHFNALHFIDKRVEKSPPCKPEILHLLPAWNIQIRSMSRVPPIFHELPKRFYLITKPFSQKLQSYNAVLSAAPMIFGWVNQAQDSSTFNHKRSFLGNVYQYIISLIPSQQSKHLYASVHVQDKYEVE